MTSPTTTRSPAELAGQLLRLVGPMDPDVNIGAANAVGAVLAAAGPLSSDDLAHPAWAALQKALGGAPLDANTRTRFAQAAETWARLQEVRGVSDPQQRALALRQFTRVLESQIVLYIDAVPGERQGQFFSQFARQKAFVESLHSAERVALFRPVLEELARLGIIRPELRGLEGDFEAIFRQLPNLGAHISTTLRNLPRSSEVAGGSGFVSAHDFSGQEQSGVIPEGLAARVADVIARNRAALERALAHHGNTLAGARAEMDAFGLTPLRDTGGPVPGEARTIAGRLAVELAAPETEATHEQRILRTLVELVEAVQSVHGRSSLPGPSAAGFDAASRPLAGTSVHAGEQVMRSKLDMLMIDVIRSAKGGADRIGHGVILGLSVADTPQGERNLRRLGFERVRNADGDVVWTRKFRGGPAEESYSRADLDALESARHQALAMIARRGIAIELNPTSNQILSGFGVDGHPVAQMLHDVASMGDLPPLRITVNTDNPGIHATTVRAEMAYLLATGAVNWPQSVRFALEGFASRFGRWPMTDAQPCARTPSVS